HTRFSRDWSSDVCSSDLVDSFSGPEVIENIGSRRALQVDPGAESLQNRPVRASVRGEMTRRTDASRVTALRNANCVGSVWSDGRSEERRVGKEIECERSA